MSDRQYPLLKTSTNCKDNLMTSMPLAGDLNETHVRLAVTDEEVAAAQRLRFTIFYEECKAKPSDEVLREKRDFDLYDTVAEHLIVVDPSRGDSPYAQIIGTYRMITQAAAREFGQFYSNDEFDISPLIDTNAYLLELGRSCVMEDYRTRPVLQLLWQGIAHFVFSNNVGLTFGCASLHGTDIENLKEELSYLHHFHLAVPELRAKALPGRYTNMNLMPASEIDEKEAFHKLPPLIKGYLRIGAKIGDGAVIDYQFNTTDVCIVLPTSYVRQRYLRHYERTTQKTVSSKILNLIPPLQETVQTA